MRYLASNVLNLDIIISKVLNIPTASVNVMSLSLTDANLE